MDPTTLIGEDISKPHILPNDKKSIDVDEIIDQKLINNLKPVHENENRNDIAKVRRVCISYLKSAKIKLILNWKFV